jgi:hypothetical protein
MRCLSPKCLFKVFLDLLLCFGVVCEPKLLSSLLLLLVQFLASFDFFVDIFVREESTIGGVLCLDRACLSFRQSSEQSIFSSPLIMGTHPPSTLCDPTHTIPLQFDDLLTFGAPTESNRGVGDPVPTVLPHLLPTQTPFLQLQKT